MNNFIIFTVAMVISGAASAERIIYQNMPNCAGAGKAIEKMYAEKDLSVGLCYRLGSWDVLAVSSDSHSWLDFKQGDTLYSTEQAVVYELPNVQFPNLADGKMEVHIENNAPVGFIFRVVQGSSKANSELYVVRLDATTAYFCGREKTNDKARLRLKQGDACKILPQANKN
jgi:hypothetical protein